MEIHVTVDTQELAEKLDGIKLGQLADDIRAVFITKRLLNPDTDTFTLKERKVDEWPIKKVTKQVTVQVQADGLLSDNGRLAANLQGAVSAAWGIVVHESRANNPYKENKGLAGKITVDKLTTEEMNAPAWTHVFKIEYNATSSSEAPKSTKESALDLFKKAYPFLVHQEGLSLPEASLSIKKFEVDSKKLEAPTPSTTESAPSTTESERWNHAVKAEVEVYASSQDQAEKIDRLADQGKNAITEQLQAKNPAADAERPAGEATIKDIECTDVFAKKRPGTGTYTWQVVWTFTEGNNAEGTPENWKGVVKAAIDVLLKGASKKIMFVTEPIESERQAITTFNATATTVDDARALADTDAMEEQLLSIANARFSGTIESAKVTNPAGANAAGISWQNPAHVGVDWKITAEVRGESRMPDEIDVMKSAEVCDTETCFARKVKDFYFGSNDVEVKSIVFENPPETTSTPPPSNPTLETAPALPPPSTNPPAQTDAETSS